MVEVVARAAIQDIRLAPLITVEGVVALAAGKVVGTAVTGEHVVQVVADEGGISVTQQRAVFNVRAQGVVHKGVDLVRALVFVFHNGFVAGADHVVVVALAAHQGVVAGAVTGIAQVAAAAVQVVVAVAGHQHVVAALAGELVVQGVAHQGLAVVVARGGLVLDARLGLEHDVFDLGVAASAICCGGAGAQVQIAHLAVDRITAAVGRFHHLGAVGARPADVVDIVAVFAHQGILTAVAVKLVVGDGTGEGVRAGSAVDDAPAGKGVAAVQVAVNAGVGGFGGDVAHRVFQGPVAGCAGNVVRGGHVHAGQTGQAVDEALARAARCRVAAIEQQVRPFCQGRAHSRQGGGIGVERRLVKDLTAQGHAARSAVGVNVHGRGRVFQALQGLFHLDEGVARVFNDKDPGIVAHGKGEGCGIQRRIYKIDFVGCALLTHLG